MKELKVGQLWETPFHGVCVIEEVAAWTVYFYPLDNPDKRLYHGIHLFQSQNTLVSQ